MACTQGLFSDSCRAAARELIRKQGEGCKLLFTYIPWEKSAEITTEHPYTKTCRPWHRAHIYYASLEQRPHLDLNIRYDAPTHSQLEFAQWMALQASLNKDRKSCNQLPCSLSMTYRTSFTRHLDPNLTWKIRTKKKKSCLRADREHNSVLHLSSINSVPAAGYRLGYRLGYSSTRNTSAVFEAN